MEANSSASGDAAASLWAAMSAASVDSPPEADAANPDEPAVLRAVDGAVLRADAPAGKGDNWRLKFMHRVGVTEGARGGGGPRDEPLAASPFAEDPRVEPPLRADSDGGAADPVVVRTVAPPRTSDSIRAAYIRKLEQSKASMPQLSRPKQAQVVTIFDWDDTLLCTTHLEAVQRQYGAIPVHVRDQLAQLEKVVHQILVQAMAAGKVFIITNASEGWVQHSSGMCMPGLVELLKQIEVISARAITRTSTLTLTLALTLTPTLTLALTLTPTLTRSSRPEPALRTPSPATRMRGRCTPSCRCRTSCRWRR